MNLVQPRLTRATLAWALAVSVLLAQPIGHVQASTVQYSVVDLGTLGGIDTRAYGVNSAGQAAGYTWAPAPGCLHAFETDAAARPTYFDPVSACSFATSVNDRGQVTGGGDHHPGSGDYTAFRYVQGGGMQDLGTLPGDSASYGTGINASGQIAGVSANGPAGHAFRWNQNSGMVNLGSLNGNTWAYGINAAGDVVGVSAVLSTRPNDYWNPGHAFVWLDSSHLMLDLNNFNHASRWAELRKAAAINDFGQVVGYGSRSSDGMIRAFRYAGGEAEDLGTFPNGGISYALGINNRGEVVGAVYTDATGAGNYRASIYRNAAGGMQKLNDLIDTVTTGWDLREAYAINDAGQIVGWGTLNNQTREFRLDPLTPNARTIQLDGTRLPAPTRTTALGVAGTSFTPNATLVIQVRNYSGGALGRVVASGTATSSSTGVFAWGTRGVNCNADLAAQAWDQLGNSNIAVINIPCYP